MRIVKNIFLIKALFVFLVLSGEYLLAGKEINFYVSNNGNDSLDGLSPTVSKTSGPLLSISEALKRAREARAKEQTDKYLKINILLRGGYYNLKEPIIITPEDSGVNSFCPLVIAPYKNEKVILSGGEEIKGLQRVPGKPGYWSTTVKDVKDGQWYFRQLFIDGKRWTRARTPNNGYFRIVGNSPSHTPVKFNFKPGDIKKDWAGRGIEVIAYLAWADFRLFIKDVDEQNNIVTLTGDVRESNRENNAKYHLENSIEFLDAPGEWFLDKNTGILTVIADEKMDLIKSVVIAPRLKRLIEFRGDIMNQRAVSNVLIRGLTFEYADWDMPSDGYADTQAAVEVHGTIFGEATIDSSIEDCTFAHFGNYAIEFARGCKNIRIQGNEIYDIGAGGIRLGEPQPRQDLFSQNFNNQILDNHIHNLGQVFSPAVGIIVFHSGQNLIAHNEIHDLFYTAISVGWNWGYQETPCHDNRIEFNHLYNIGKALLSDMGGIYTLGIQKGTVIRNNLIHDIEAFTYGGWGIYPDEGSSYILIENNIVYNAKSAGFHQHYGRENIIRNNIFAFNKENQLMRTREENHISFVFERNIVYFNSGNLLGSNWANDKFKMDYNIYYDTRIGSDPAKYRFGKDNLEQWRARGHDVHSVIMDPLFVDPEKYNFLLRPDSPALKFGFKQIDINDIGIRPKHKRQ